MIMLWSGLSVGSVKVIFTVLIIAIIYMIIFFALKVMYKDIKGGGKKKVVKKRMGLEVVKAGENENMKKGSVIPLGTILTIGRKPDNMLIMKDQYCSGHHARIFLKNGTYFLEDMESTNGTLLNGSKLEGKSLLNIGDEIKIGSCFLKVIG